MAKERATILDVARLAGVSVATVSIVINNNKKYVAPALRQKISDAIEILNYKPNLVARSLKVKETKTIALVLTNITSPVTPIIVRTVQMIASEHGFDTIISVTEEDKKIEVDAVYSMLSKRVDGMIICPTSLSLDQHLSYASSMIPVVAIERRNNLTSCVITDNREICFEAAKHLIGHNRKRIGLISMPILGSNTQDRILGVQSALKEHGLFYPELTKETDYIGQSSFNLAVDLISNQHVDAIMTTSQSIALGTYKAAKALGATVPDNLAIFGYDDVSWMEVVDSPISTIKQPIKEMAERACRALFDALKAETNTPRIDVLKSELIIRHSCGC